MSVDLEPIRAVQGIGRTVRRAIWLIGGVLALIFSWIQLRDIPVASLIEKTEPDLLLRFTLALYYSCWVFGTTFDTNLQSSVYVRDPNRGLIPKFAYVLLIGFGVVAALLMWASKSEAYFAIVLTFFVACNIGGFCYVLSYVRPIMAASKEQYELKRDYFGLEQLDLVIVYMSGRWQWLRFIAMVVMAIAMNVIVFSDSARALVARLLATIAPPASAESIDRLIPSLSFLIFVLVAEGWIWAQRLRVRTTIDLVEILAAKYIVRPKALVQLADSNLDEKN
jgi:hypothetical protein